MLGSFKDLWKRCQSKSREGKPNPDPEFPHDHWDVILLLRQSLCHYSKYWHKNIYSPSCCSSALCTFLDHKRWFSKLLSIQQNTYISVAHVCLWFSRKCAPFIISTPFIRQLSLPLLCNSCETMKGMVHPKIKSLSSFTDAVFFWVQQEKVIQVWNDISMSKWWQNYLLKFM